MKENESKGYLSQPSRVVSSELATIFYMPIRQNPEKPGRTLEVAYDAISPLIESFRPNYIELVRFEKPGIAAGNHFHSQRSELMIAVTGELQVALEDVQTQAQQIVELGDGEYAILYVRAGVAHAVTALSTDATLRSCLASW